MFNDGDGFQSLMYGLFVQDNDNKEFSIFLSPRQVTENYLFDILVASGISFLKKIAFIEYDDNQVNEFLEKYNNVLIESPYEQSSLLIEDQGHIVLSNDNLLSIPKYNLVRGFHIYDYEEDEPVDEIIKQLVEVLNEVDAKVEVF